MTGSRPGRPQGAGHPGASRSRARRVGKRLLLLAIGVAAAYGLPALVPAVRTAAAGLVGLPPVVPAAAVLLEAASLACFSALTLALLGAARRPGFGTVLRIDLAVYGLGRVLPAAPATGGALRLRLLTAAGVSRPDALFLATVEGTGSALLLFVLLDLALVVAIPVRGGGPLEITAAVAGTALLVAAGLLGAAVARGGAAARRAAAFAVRWVPGVDADRAARAVRAVRDEAAHLRGLAADPRRFALAVGWGSANWLLDAAALAVFLAGAGAVPSPLALFVAYAVAGVLGVLPLTPGGVGVVEGVLVPLLVAAGVPARVALTAVLGWRLVNYWLPLPVGALAWLTLRHRPA